jgi:hypothetical protein
VQHSTTPHTRLSTIGRALAGCALATLAVTTGAVAQELPRPADAPAPVHAATAADRDDGRVHLVMGAFVTAAGTDVASSMYMIGRGAAREAAFGKQWQDSPVAFAATKSALTALFVYQLQRLHRTRPKAAFILGIAGTSVEAALIARTSRLQRAIR